MGNSGTVKYKDIENFHSSQTEELIIVDGNNIDLITNLTYFILPSNNSSVNI